VACLAQLVNAIAPIMTRTGGPAWRQTIFHPFAQMSRFGRGRVLRAELDAPTYAARYSDPQGASDIHFSLPAVPYLKFAAVQDPARARLSLFALNRHLSEPLDLEIAVPGFGAARVSEALQLQHHDLHAANTVDQPDRVAPARLQGVAASADGVRATLRPASWNLICLEPDPH